MITAVHPLTAFSAVVLNLHSHYIATNFICSIGALDGGDMMHGERTSNGTHIECFRITLPLVDLWNYKCILISRFKLYRVFIYEVEIKSQDSSGLVVKDVDVRYGGLWFRPRYLLTFFTMW